MEYALIYGISIADQIRAALFVTAALGAAGGFMAIMGAMMPVEGESVLPISWKALLVVFFTSVALRAAIPSKEAAIQIAAASGVAWAAQQDEVQKVASKIGRIIDKKLDEAMADE